MISSLSGSTEFVWYEDPWIREMMRNALMVIVLAVVTLGLIRPLLTQFLASTGESGGYGNVMTSEYGEIIDLDVIEME